MSDLEVYQGPPSNLAQWANEARSAASIAQSVTATSFVPKHYQGKPQEATAAIMRGAELGLSPLASLSALVNIQGTPALTAQALRAVVQSHGHSIWIDSSSDKKVVAKGRRKGDPDDVVHTSTWTLDRASKLGLTGKDNWRKQPEAMLIARATSEVARMVASDALLGVAYSVEELSDGGDEPPAPSRRVARKSTREGHEGVIEDVVEAVRTPAELPAPIEADEPIVVEDRNDRAEPPLSKMQLGKILALFGDIGWKDRDDRLRATRALIGREIESANDLTKTEASRLIDELEPIANMDDPSSALTDTLEALNG